MTHRPPPLRTLLRHLFSLLLVPAALAAPNWVPITFYRGDFAHWHDQRLAMLAEVQVGELHCQMQIDTGLNDAVHWQAPEQDSPEEKVPVQIAGASWQVAIAKTTLDRLASPQGCASGAKMGNIGTGFFERGTVTFDLKANRLGYEEGSQLAVAQSSPLIYAQWPNWGWGGFPLVEIYDKEQRVGLALFDTGSAAIGLSLMSEADWRRALATHTGKHKPSVAQLKVPAWDKLLPAQTAEISSPWQAGSLPLGKLRLFHAPEQGFKPAEPLMGVLGLQSFGEATIALDIPGRRWQVRP